MPDERKKSGRPLPTWAIILIKVSKAIWVPLLCILALYAGLVIGYSYLGGQNPADVLKPSTWKHLYDLVFAE
ncbi:MAG TPA: DNA-directed RNA polymerase subunit beta [Bacilli bacterium]